MLGGSFEKKNRSHNRKAINMENLELTQDFRSCKTNNKFQFCNTMGKWQWCARVIFVESESQDLQVRAKSESSKIFSSRVRVKSWLSRVELKSSHKSCWVTSSLWFARSIQCRVKLKFTFLQWLFRALKWCPKCYKKSPGELENGAQCCFSKFHWRLIMS